MEYRVLCKRLYLRFSQRNDGNRLSDCIEYFQRVTVLLFRSTLMCLNNGGNITFS